MGRKRYSPEQIITMLLEAEILISQGNQLAEVCRKLGVTEQNYYRRRKEYDGMRVDQAKRLKELEPENAGLNSTQRHVRKFPELYIESGSSWENGYVESYFGKLRDELLNGEILDTLMEAKVLVESWPREYNRIRPHSSLGYRPPAPEAYEIDKFTLGVVH